MAKVKYCVFGDKCKMYGPGCKGQQGSCFEAKILAELQTPCPVMVENGYKAPTNRCNILKARRKWLGQGLSCVVKGQCRISVIPSQQQKEIAKSAIL
jgi:hypothetical protein